MGVGYVLRCAPSTPSTPDENPRVIGESGLCEMKRARSLTEVAQRSWAGLGRFQSTEYGVLCAM
ncbi:hypothetical protein N7492_009608 [Penicillium capsulatum]|uniref:Uncharacterized protein n=1 Tax=Penicillium capsulatum TaxID=69766 RepID=A0A9W9LIF4_9EURO|nr:hypothetical protein N7492_009608 [Penicillium capsulatum]